MSKHKQLAARLTTALRTVKAALEKQNVVGSLPFVVIDSEGKDWPGYEAHNRENEGPWGSKLTGYIYTKEYVNFDPNEEMWGDP